MPMSGGRGLRKSLPEGCEASRKWEGRSRGSSVGGGVCAPGFHHVQQAGTHRALWTGAWISSAPCGVGTLEVGELGGTRGALWAERMDLIGPTVGGGCWGGRGLGGTHGTLWTEAWISSAPLWVGDVGGGQGTGRDPRGPVDRSAWISSRPHCGWGTLGRLGSWAGPRGALCGLESAWISSAPLWVGTLGRISGSRERRDPWVAERIWTLGASPSQILNCIFILYYLLEMLLKGVLWACRATCPLQQRV